MGRQPSVNKNLPPRMRARRRGDTIYYFFDAGGRPRREIPLGKDYVLAVREWSKLSMDPEPVKITVGWLVVKYLASTEFDQLGPGTRADYKFALDKISEFFGAAPVDDVQPPHVRRYVDLRSAGTDKLQASRHRALREKSILAMLYNWGGAYGYTRHNPAGVFRPLRYARLDGRKNIDISDAMLDAVYSRGTVALQDAMDLAYYIGQRPADTLKVKDTDLVVGFLEVVQNKTGVRERIEIKEGLAALVERVQARKRAARVHSLSQVFLVDELGLPMTKAKLRSRFEAARDAAGIDGADFQFRDLRRKAGTDLREQVGIRAAQDLLGHKTEAMTEHYTGARGKIISAIPRRTASKGR